MAELKAKGPPPFDELASLRRRVAWLEIELQACGSPAFEGTLSKWLNTLPKEQWPELRTCRALGEVLRPFEGVELAPHEGLWIIDLLEGRATTPGSYEEAIVFLLGTERILTSVTPKGLALLKEEFEEEGYFDDY